MEMNDKQFAQVLDVIYKYVGQVQFAMDKPTVEVLQAQLKKDIEITLTKTTN